MKKFIISFADLNHKIRKATVRAKSKQAALAQWAEATTGGLVLNVKQVGA
jgi:hypothetical protein